MVEYSPRILKKKIKKIQSMMEDTKAEKGITHKDYKKLQSKLQDYETDLKAAGGVSAAAGGASPKTGSIKDRINSYKSNAGPTTSNGNSLKSRSAAFQKAAGSPAAKSNAVTPSPKTKKVGSLKSKASPFGASSSSSSAKTPSPSKTSSPSKKTFSSPAASKFGASKATGNGSGGKTLKDRSAAFQNSASASKSTSPTPKKTTGGFVKAKKFGSPSAANGATKSPGKIKKSKVGSIKGSSPFGKTKTVTPSPKKKKGAKKIGSIGKKANDFKSQTTTPFGGGTPSKVGKLKGASHFKPNTPGKYTSTNKNAGTPPPKKNANLLTKTSTDASTDTRAQAAVDKLKDKSKSDMVRGLIERIDNAGGFPVTRRLSVRDNDLVSNMTKAIHNDPTVTEIIVDTDPRFEHVSKALVDAFAESLRSNLHITKISIQGVDLGNQFLSSLATSIETNFTLREINLKNNSFTNDALIEFCQSMPSNKSLLKVELSKQNSPIFENAEESVFEALEQNDIVKQFSLDFKTKTGPKRLKKFVERNKNANKSPVAGDDQLLKFLQFEMERAEELFEQRKAEETILVVKDDDWGYLYELSQLFDKYKLGDMVVLDDDDDGTASKAGSTGRRAPSRAYSGSSDGKSMDTASTTGFAMPMTADGEFLDEEFISSFLVEKEEKGSLVFDFCNQFKLFKRFPKTDPARPLIVKKFVDALLSHPQMKNIISINMANSCCDNDFFEALADRCFENEKMLPKLNTLNVETNFITEKGAVAIAKCVGSPTTFQYLQVLRLENQKALLSSKAELKLAHALCVNRSVVRFSLRVRNLLERQQINKYIQRNVDFLRQARRHHAIKTGTLQERKRNEMEQYFDKIAANDPEITDVEIVGNNRFLSLNQEEKVKSGAAFENNTHVTTLQMSTLKLDCKFAVALAKSLESNSTIERVLLDSNAIADEGLSAIMASMSKNSTVIELQIRHQSKPTSSATEDELCDLLGGNTTLVKLGLDIRSQLAKIKLDKKMAQNREIQRKARVKANKK